MIKTITKSEFRDEFLKSDKKQSFTYDGISKLYDYLEETNPNYELDIIELDGDFCQYTASELIEAFAHLDLELNELLGYLDANTVVLQVDDETWIVQNFLTD